MVLELVVVETLMAAMLAVVLEPLFTTVMVSRIERRHDTRPPTGPLVHPTNDCAPLALEATWTSVWAIPIMVVAVTMVEEAVVTIETTAMAIEISTIVWIEAGHSPRVAMSRFPEECFLNLTSDFLPPLFSSHQPQMYTLKQYLNSLDDDSIDEMELITKYNEYKTNFKRKVIQEFFNRHKDEDW